MGSTVVTDGLEGGSTDAGPRAERWDSWEDPAAARGPARPPATDLGGTGLEIPAASVAAANGQPGPVDDLVQDAFLYEPITRRQRDLVHRVVELGLAFLDGSCRDGRPYIPLDNETLRTLASHSLPTNGSTTDELFELLEHLARHSIAQCDPSYLAFPDTGNSLAGLVGDLVVACLNQNMIAVDRSAPVGSYLEAQLILWLRELIGHPTYSLPDLPNLAALGGMWTSGGNMSNHVAIAAALQHRFPEAALDGLSRMRRRPVVALARGVEHFSYASAAQVLGLGRDAMLWSSPNPDFTSDPEALRDALSSAPDDVEPFMAVAVAGNCRTTSLDNLEAIADICEEFGVWLHVDACHGGSLLFSRSLKSHLAGIERADSVSLDPHKGLFTTYACSFALFRDPTALARFARYPAKIEDPSCLDLGLITPFYGSRRFESLKLWLLIKHLGTDGLEQIVDARHQTFLDLVGVLQDLGYFMLLNAPAFYRVAFVFLPEDVRELLVGHANSDEDRARARQLVDDFTYRFSESLYRDGRVVFDLFSVQDLGDVLTLGREHKYQVMGMAVGHPLVPDQVRDRLREVVHEIGEALAVEMRSAAAQFGLSDAYRQAPVATSGPAGW